MNIQEKLNNFLKNLKNNRLADVDFGKFLNWEYLTDPTPTKIFIYEQWTYVIVLINLMIALICFKFVANKFFDIKPKCRIIRKISFLWFSNSIFLLLYNLLRAGGVKFLSMRLFLLLILFAYVGILIYSLIYWLLVLPKAMKKFQEAKLRDKYSKRR